MEVRRPSPLWLLAAVAAGIAAVVLALAAYSAQREAARPIGEGQLFARDAAAAPSMVPDGVDMDTAVRLIRNDLSIEAVSFIDTTGTITSSTSPSLVGNVPTNGVLAFGFESGRFVAVAAPITHTITIDGVPEWQPGDILYRVLQPTAGGAYLLDYDIGELLERRSRTQGVGADAIRLGLGGLALGIVAGGLLVGRARTARRNRELAREARLMRRHTVELERTNAQLITARRQAEEALELAEEKNRVRAEFVLMINHELRTPLTAVVTGADLLLADRSLEPATRDEILATMVLDGKRLEEMINQMLVVARIENRGLNLDFTRLAGDDVCAEIAAAHPGLVHQPHHDPLPEAVTDRATFTQLIHSLVDNARTHGATTVTLDCLTEVPFTPQVEVGSRPESCLTLVIADDGPGIDPEFLPRIFEKYEKDSFSPGTGLGLYLARMMIEALGGSIAVATSDRGTCIAVSIEAVGQEVSWATV